MMTEFEIGGHKYTPETVTYNSTFGAIWTHRILRDGAWLHDGKDWAPAKSTRAQIVDLFNDSGDLDWDREIDTAEREQDSRDC